MDQPGEFCNRQRNEVLSQNLLNLSTEGPVGSLEVSTTERVSTELWDLIEKGDRKAGVLGHPRVSYHLL